MRALSVVIFSLLLGGCMSASQSNKPLEGGASHANADETSVPVDGDAANAIPLNDDSGAVMVPVGADSEGCERYEKHVPGQATKRVLYYRDEDGAFSTSRSGCKS